MIHTLKIKDEYLQNLLIGSKRSEIRYNDRDYQKDDLLRFFDTVNPEGTNEVLFKITHVHSGLGMAEGYVSLSVIHLD